jgi:hypothetical protein
MAARVIAEEGSTMIFIPESIGGSDDFVSEDGVITWLRHERQKLTFPDETHGPDRRFIIH